MSIDTKTFEWLRELLTDCLRSGRLSDGERRFTADLHRDLLRDGPDMSLTDRQTSKLRQIEEKVYACG